MERAIIFLTCSTSLKISIRKLITIVQADADLFGMIKLLSAAPLSLRTASENRARVSGPCMSV